MKAVNDGGALQISHLQTMFFNSASRAYDRVKQLADSGYLTRRYITEVATAPAASPMVFTLGKLGGQVVADSYGLDGKDLNYGGRVVNNWEKLKHLLAVNDVWAAIYRACADHPDLELVRWWPERHFRTHTDKIGVRTVGGRQVAKPFYPDGYCLVKAPGGYAHYFLEADRGTEGQRQFFSQVEIYQAYVASGRYQERFQTTSLRVLVVSPNKRRQDNLRRTTLQARGEGVYLFTTYDRVMPESVLLQPIWVSPRGSDARALLTV